MPGKPNKKPIAGLISGLAFALVASPAFALGIGDVISQPRLGERLRIEIALLAAPDETIDPACLKLAPADSGDDLPWVRQAKLRVQRGARSSLIVESAEIVNHPIFMLGVRVGCGAEVRREFTFMPQAGATPAAAPGAPQVRAAESASAPGGWQTVEGETLGGIAAALYPGAPSAQRRFVRNTARANPQLFAGVSDPANHPMPGGTTLVVPTTRLAVQTDTAPTPAAPRDAAAPAPRKAPARRTKPQQDGDLPANPSVSAPRAARGGDRLSVSAVGDPDSGLKFATVLDEGRSRGVTDARREQLRQEQRLIAELDEKIVASLALAEKIRNMEAYLAKLQADMVQLDQNIKTTNPNLAGAPALPTAQPATPPAGEAAVNVPAVATPTTPPPQPAATEQPAEKPAAPAVAAKPPAAPTAEDDSPNYWLWGGLGFVLASALGLLLLKRRAKSDDDMYPAAYDEEDEPEEEQEEAPQPRPAPTPVRAQPVPAEPTEMPSRLDSIAPLELRTQEGEDDNRIGVAEHDSALELAEIMLSFGRVQGAAQTLSDYIDANPRQAVRPWLKLLEVYHTSGMRVEFDALMHKMHANFNAEVASWEEYPSALTRTSLEQVPHLIEPLVAHWGERACLDFLQNAVLDNREGTRAGFPLGVVDDIATLIGLLEARSLKLAA